MQLNKKNCILDKAKLICVKLDKVFLIFPYTISKIELRMRNLIINNRSILDGISHFMNFFLINLEFQTHLMNKYTEHLKKQQELEYDKRFKKGSKNLGMNNS